MPDHPTCATCKHWKPKDGGKTGMCESDRFVYVDVWSDDDTPTDGLGYWDYESYHAGFDTGPSFYCPHHTDLPPRAA